MWSPADLVSHLPRLRRYARALCGSRLQGDDLVMLTIRNLELAHIEAARDPLIALFRLLTATWNAAQRAGRQTIDKTPSQTVGEHRLKGLEPIARQVFLLTAVETFGCDEAREILELDRVRFDEVYASLAAERRAATSTEVLIIEDDAFVSADLERIMTATGYRVTGVARTHEQAVELASIRCPGLILCDVHLADGSSGTRAVKDILAGGRGPVVYITSDRARLLESCSHLPEFYIAKPYSAEQVRSAARQALFFQPADGAPEAPA